MDRTQISKIRQFMRESGIKHYIYGIGTLSGAKKAVNIYCESDEEYDSKVKEILADNWNVEILAIHLFD